MLKTVSSVANALGALNYKGTWNANANTPTLASGVGTQGDYYVVSVAGATDLDGITNWGIGDWAAFNGSIWQRLEGGADGNFVNLTVSGLATFNGNAQFPDNSKAIFGAGSDLQIYHDGSHSYVVDAGTGNMYISTNGNGIVMQASLSETMFSALPNGAVTLYHDNAAKIATTATGIDVTGSVTADGANIDGAVTTGDITIDNDDTPTLNFKKASSADVLGTINVSTDAGSGGKMVFQTKRNGNTAVDRMTITDDGSVGIGTDTPLYTAASRTTTTINGASSANLSFGVGGTGYGNIYVASDTMNIGTQTAANPINFTIGGATKATLDASGNLLVGTTDTTIYNNSANNATDNGMVYAAVDSRLDVTRYTTNAAAAVASFNRTGNDGSILSFARSGTAVGFIGVDNGDNIYLEGLLGGIQVGTNVVLPHKSGTTANGQIDLGATGSKWKDLYLSGGVVFGDAGGSGTSSSNTLDSYEEGTWTPVIAGGTCTNMTGKYTKVGNQVTVILAVVNGNLAGTSGNVITGLPFTSTTRSTAGAVAFYNIFSVDDPVGYLGAGVTSINFIQNTASSAWSTANFSNSAATYFHFSLTYFV